MYNNLIGYINSHLKEAINQAAIDKIKQAFSLKKIRKHQFFLQEGEICKKAGFMLPQIIITNWESS